MAIERIHPPGEGQGSSAFEKHWTVAISIAASLLLAQFASGCTQNAAFDGDANDAIVIDAYCLMLDRNPDPGGFNTYKTALDQGSITPSQFLSIIFNSDEYQNQDGYHGQAGVSTLSDADFVTNLYVQLLGRQPDPTGLASYMNDLASGTSRADLFAGFIDPANGPEFENDHPVFFGAQPPSAPPPPSPPAPPSTPSSPPPPPPPPQPSNCIASGDEKSIQSALVNVADEAMLCPNATFTLGAPIEFTAANQKIFTQGNPTDGSRATLIVNYVDLANSRSQAIIGHQSNIEIRNIIVDGNRRGLGYQDDQWMPELLELGGADPTGAGVTGQVVDHVKAFDPVGWSVLHLYESADPGSPCANATITSNEIGPSGEGYQGEWQRRADGGGPWADGISLACTDSYVGYNTVLNATDGGIVVFGAPGSTIDHNLVETISGTISDGQTMIGGINLEDWNPYQGNYADTLVEFNTIDAEDGYIRTGIALGPAAAGISADQYNDGALVENNILQGSQMGYGIVVDGMLNATVNFNTFSATYTGDISRCPSGNLPPEAYVVDLDHSSGYFQDGYSAGAIYAAQGCTNP